MVEHAKSKIEQICKAFDSAWRNGEHEPSVHDYLALAGEAESDELLRSLVAIDVDHRFSSKQLVDAQRYSQFGPTGHEFARARIEENKRRSEETAPGQLRIQTEYRARADEHAVDSNAIRIGNYELLEEIGKGGMGSVFLARHSLLTNQNRLAVKLIRSDQKIASEAIDRFWQEIRLLGKIGRHPNIIAAQDAGEHKGVPYIVMEFVEGTDCQRLLRTHSGRLSIAEACEIVLQAAQGVQFAHDKGILHRDLKPANLMLTDQGVVKVLDLGVGRIKGEDALLTSLGAAVGTINYMAPEQIQNSTAVTEAADIYSLGCTLFQLLTGAPPFSRNKFSTSYEVMHAHINEVPELVSRFRKEVPTALAQVVAKCLEKEPGKRIGSAEELSTLMRPFAGGADLLALLGKSNNEKDAVRQELQDTGSIPQSDTSRSFTTVTRQAPRNVKTAKRWWFAASAAAACLLAVSLMLQQIVFRTKSGDLVVRTSGGEVQLSVRNESELSFRDPTDDEIVSVVVDHRKRLLVFTKRGFRTETRRFDLNSVDGRGISVQFFPIPSTEDPSRIDSNSSSDVHDKSSVEFVEKMLLDKGIALTKDADGLLFFDSQHVRLSRNEIDAILAAGAEFQVFNVDGNYTLEEFARVAEIPFRHLRWDAGAPGECVELLSKNTSLTHLELERCAIDKKSVEALGNLTIDFLKVSEPFIEKEDLRSLLRLRLDGIYLAGIPILADDELEVLASNKSLRKLYLHGCDGIADSSLSSLSSMQLETVSCANGFSDLAIMNLCKMSSVRSLGISSDRLSDAVFGYVSRLPDLVYLQLSSSLTSGNGITGDGLAQIASCSKLVELVLAPFDPAYANQLLDLEALERLHLSWTPSKHSQTQIAVDQLLRMKQLRNLHLSWATSAQRKQLVAALGPACEIVVDEIVD